MLTRTCIVVGCAQPLRAGGGIWLPVAVVVDVVVVVGAKLLQSTTRGPSFVELHVPHPEVIIIPLAAPVQSLLANCHSSVALPPLTEFLVDLLVHVPEDSS